MIEIKEEDGLLHLFLNNPDKRNALNLELLQGLCQHIERALNDSTIRVVVFRGNGPLFCSGLDLNEMLDDQLREKMGFLLMRILHDLQTASFISIAGVHGAAIAGGAGLMAACDIAIATDECRIGFPEVRRGVVAAQVATILAHQLSARHLRELLITGELISAQRALQIGLVNAIVPAASLESEIRRMTDAIFSGAPDAINTTKRLVDQLTAHNLAQEMQHALALFHTTWATPEAAEGIAAFQEHRSPLWK